MKIVFLVFRNNYRFFALGNFAKSRKYGDVLIISLGGKFKSIIGSCLYYLGIGKFISIDGSPFLKNRNNSINFWLTGTSLKILNKYNNYKNNFVNMNNSIIGKEKKIFQIYPIIKKNYKINSLPKIIFMGKLHFYPRDKNFVNVNFLKENKNRLIQDFSLVDKSKFWSKIYSNKNSLINLENYKIIKTYQRKQIISKIHKNFKNFLYLFGENSKKSKFHFHKPIYDNAKVQSIYNGNICIDTGSVFGSMSLHPRSIQIIENGGLIIQTKQQDADIIWGEMNNKIIFNNIDKLIESLDAYLSNPNKCDEILEMTLLHFKNSEKKINKNLNKLLFKK